MAKNGQKWPQMSQNHPKMTFFDFQSVYTQNDRNFALIMNLSVVFFKKNLKKNSKFFFKKKFFRKKSKKIEKKIFFSKKCFFPKNFFQINLKCVPKGFGGLKNPNLAREPHFGRKWPKWPKSPKMTKNGPKLPKSDFFLTFKVFILKMTAILP